MTIQAFARLCGCNPQTLRYYDKVDLLRPARVDRFTGYRYYDEEQALTFVKIKNLQLGGFAIEEIKPLLTAPVAAVNVLPNALQALLGACLGTLVGKQLKRNLLKA